MDNVIYIGGVGRGGGDEGGRWEVGRWEIGIVGGRGTRHPTWNIITFATDNCSKAIA